MDKDNKPGSKQYSDIFSRKKGFSKGVYRSLNCGLGSKDSKFRIKKNLNFVSKKLQIKEKNLKLMYQTHSNKVSIITRKNLGKKRFHSDAMITTLKGIGIGVLTADCVPILLYENKKRIVGCIHAGWRGAFLGIIENTIKKITTLLAKKVENKGSIIIASHQDLSIPHRKFKLT